MTEVPPAPAVEAAAAWITSTAPTELPRPLTPHLRRTFSLTALEACTAISIAQRRRAEARPTLEPDR